MSLRPISGRELAEQVNSLEFKEVCQRYVAPSPGRALNAIKERFGSRPTPDGHSNPAIAEIRRILAASATNPSALNGLMITAPHSHWHDGRPIVIRFENDRYTIGPYNVQADETYTPVSFALTNNGPFAYEWADSSIDLLADEVAVTHTLVQQVNDSAGKMGWPLGLALAFRFKSLLAPQSISAVEYTFEDAANGEEDGIILTREELDKLAPGAGYAQVGWHAYADETAGLTSEAVQAAKRIRDLAKDMSRSEQLLLRALIENEANRVRLGQEDLT